MRHQVSEFILQFGIGLAVYLVAGMLIGVVNERPETTDNVTFGLMVTLALLTSHCAGGGVLRYFGG